jgi:cytochrome c oxidase assembly factor CtaG
MDAKLQYFVAAAILGLIIGIIYLVETARSKNSGNKPGNYKIPMTLSIMASIMFLAAVCSDIEINGERLGPDHPTYQYGQS